MGGDALGLTLPSGPTSPSSLALAQKVSADAVVRTTTRLFSLLVMPRGSVKEQVGERDPVPDPPQKKVQGEGRARPCHFFFSDYSLSLSISLSFSLLSRQEWATTVSTSPKPPPCVARA